MSKWSKKLKKVSVILIATAMMAVTVVGCGEKGNSDVSVSEGESDSQGMLPKDEDGTSTVAKDDEIVKLKVWGFGYTATSDECAAVAEAISEITREKIGVEVELVRNSDGEKLNLALTSGEQLDLVSCHTYPGGLSTLVNNGMATPLDDLVQEYGQGILATVDKDMLDTCVIDDTLYAIPCMKGIANGYGSVMRLDILEELGIDPADIKTWDDVHDVLVKVKETYPDMYPLVPSWEGGGMQKMIPYDNLGTGFLDALGVLENVFDDNTTVVNLYETDAYRELCERMYQWNQEGLIMPDAPTSTETNLCATVGFSALENDTPTKKTEVRVGWKHEGAIIRLIEPYINSDAGGGALFIPSESKYPEKAMQLWNLMYTDPEISKLFVCGIENVNYKYTDESRNYITSVEGSTYDYIDWCWPNSWITPVREGDDLDKWDQLKTFCDEAHRSPALGFTFDSSAVMNEITACNNVIAKYEVGLRWGVLDPDEALPKFNEELKAAGLETIIAEKQSQLDAFLGK